MIKELEKLPQKIKEFLKVCSKIGESLGYRIFLVGGIVRDLILERKNFDFDIVVEGEGITFAHQIAMTLGIDYTKHHTFGTASVYFDRYKIDIATARRESYPKWGALPKVKKASLKEDLFRRDFTINAMAISLNREDYGELIDFYGGMSDIKKEVIRVLHSQSFLEDPTRILRAIRFHTRFSFSIEKNTLNWLREAVKIDALKFVNPHRLRDELILILKEESPAYYIKKINKLVGFSFIDTNLELNKSDFNLFFRIERAINRYKDSILPRQIDKWLIYLMGLMIFLSPSRVRKFCQRFALRKGDTQRLVRLKEAKKRIERLKNKKGDKVAIYKALNPLSFEEIIFFSAYFKDKKIRGNIDYFLKHLCKVHLKIKGKDLKEIGLKPLHLYNKTLRLLLYRKIKKELVTKQEEILEAKEIFKYLLRRTKRD